jgi:glycosyltransferase involved in cell wall biosynthesis
MVKVMITNPAITIILSFKDGGDLLLPAVNSILNQSFKNWELLIFDNGSTDGSHYSIQHITDKRVKFYQFDKTESLSVRLNQGIDLARGKYIARMDHDDICFLDRLDEQFKFLEANNQYDLVASNCLLINRNNDLIGVLYENIDKKHYGKGILSTFPYPHPTWMGKVSWFKKYHYTEKPEPYLCEDQELLLRSYNYSKIMRLDSILLAYRIDNKKSITIQNKRYFTLLKFQIPALIKSRNFSLIFFSIAVFFIKDYEKFIFFI